MQQLHVAAVLLHCFQLGDDHAHPGAVDVGYTAEIEHDLREAAINEIMNPLPERQISIVEQHFSRQDEDQVSRGPAPCIRGVVRLLFVSPAGIAMSRVPPAGVGHDTNSVGCHV
jgi:hypothetical protein